MALGAGCLAFAAVGWLLMTGAAPSGGSSATYPQGEARPPSLAVAGDARQGRAVAVRGELSIGSTLRPAVSGSFVAVAEDATEVLVSVQEGQFSAVLPGPGEYRIDRIVLGGTSGFSAAPIAIPPCDPIVRVKVPCLVVGVVDGKGNEVEGAMAVPVGSSPVRWGPAIERERYERSAGGVICLDADHTHGGWFVGADGYAWCLIAGGSATEYRRVTLEPEARIVARTQPKVAWYSPAFTLARVDGASMGPLSPGTWRDGALTLGGLAAGTYRLRLLPWLPESYAPLHDVELTVHSGETAESVVQIVPQATGSLRLRVDGRWKVPEGAVIRVQGLEGTAGAVRLTRPLAEAFGAGLVVGDVPAGLYLVDASVVGVYGSTRVTSGDLRLVTIGAPRHLRVKVVASEGGRVLSGASLKWQTPAEEEGIGLLRAASGKDGEFDVWVGMDSVRLLATCEGYTGRYEDLSAGDGRDVVIQLDRASVVRITISPRDGTPSLTAVLTVVDGEEVYEAAEEDGQIVFNDVEVGLYRLVLNAEDRVHTEHSVRVDEGRTVEVAVSR